MTIREIILRSLIRAICRSYCGDLAICTQNDQIKPPRLATLGVLFFLRIR